MKKDMYTIEILEKLFGNAAKVKIIRLFLFNPNSVFDAAEISSRAKIAEKEARKEVGILESIGLVKKKLVLKILENESDKKSPAKKKKIPCWMLDQKFAYLKPLQSFLIDISPLGHGDILRKISRAGKMKLILVAGLFIQNWDSRVDILVVGDSLKRGALENIIRGMESEIGKELRYCVFDTEDFQYRLGMCDKLVRDILDYPHEKVLDKLGVQ